MKLEQTIFNFVEAKTGIEASFLKQKNRSNEVVRARDLFIYIALKSGISGSQTGRWVNKDHTTIIHSTRKNKNDVEFSELFEVFKTFRTKSMPDEDSQIRVKLTGKYAYLYERFGGKCAVCLFHEVVEVHHIIPRRVGGDDSPENLILLCPNHHALADRGMLSIEGIPVLMPSGERVMQGFSTYPQD